MKKVFKVATRASPLAMAQAKMAVEYLLQKIENADFEIIPMRTMGDKKLEWSLEKFGGKGLFTKELEDALLAGNADFAVHSAKDLPTEIPSGLAVPCFLPRDDCRDTLVYKGEKSSIKKIATASPRRRAQMKNIFKDATFSEIRGNVHTRLSKLLDGDIDATILSSAGLERLKIFEFDGLIFERFNFAECVPAAAQGVIAIETRQADAPYFSQFCDLQTKIAVDVERKFLAELGGGCQVAFGANFDGKIFRIFHEKVGFKEFDFSNLSTSQMLCKIAELASEIKSIS